MKVTLGGDRLGSGNKNKQTLHEYNASTFNLDQKFTSSLQCGTLYPFTCIPAMRGDKFTFDLHADARTIPTKGPLFGSFKMQVDLFQCDVRLYQALLHNNPLALGLKMNQVKFPILSIEDGQSGHPFANNCLLKYLGLSGIGKNTNTEEFRFVRAINAIPALAYYEIFKTYYANKQEEYAYTIGTETLYGDVSGFEFSISSLIDNTIIDTEIGYNTYNEISTYLGLPIQIEVNRGDMPNGYENNIYINFLNGDNYIGSISFAELMNTQNPNEVTDKKCLVKSSDDTFILYAIPTFPSAAIIDTIGFTYLQGQNNYEYKRRGLERFALENIDEMRLNLLSHHQLGTAFEINNDATIQAGKWTAANGKDQDGMPYIKLVDGFRNTDVEGSPYYSQNCTPLNGLCVKTYQSDLFNNWVNTEWIDGENGIAAVTAISTASGSFTIDSLNLAEKMYNMLNRIAVSDGSYDGWQDAVYTETPRRHIESPIYLGGLSSEIVFEEIVQTSQGNSDSPLGTLGGKGKLLKRKGGHVVVKTNEAAFIIGIVSLTPRVNYSQGNEFYMTDLLSMDDFHKPALDGIGFQNLIGERLAWFDTRYTSAGWERHTVGKVPAWIEYMTAVDKTYGDFAETGGRGFMALNREYEEYGLGGIRDATTYIDPRKYNYAFAVSDIDAQNFWVQIYSEVTARRLMSAKQIPNI